MAKSIVEIALSQLGVTEATGENDGLPATRYNRSERKAWCAAFAAWVYSEAGKKLPGNPWMLASVQYMEDQCKAKGLWWASAITRLPKPGALIFFGNRGASDPSRSGGRHMGIVIDVDVKSGVIHTIEGNLGNAVRKAEHPIGSNRVLGFAEMA